MEEGFTLIELLIVIVVLGILAAVTVFALSGTTAKSASSACNADAQTVNVALAAYDAQNTPGTITSGTGSNLIPNYLQSWPSNTSHYIIAVSGVNGTGTAQYVTVQSVTPAVAAAQFPAPNGGTNPCAGVT
jgi:prepilin-type N-terminal cleavage/methylation domain-containing protein